MSFSTVMGNMLYVGPSIVSGYFSVNKLACGSSHLFQSIFGSNSIYSRAEIVAKQFFSKENICELSFGQDDCKQRLSSLKQGVVQSAQGLIYGAISYALLSQVM